MKSLVNKILYIPTMIDKNGISFGIFIFFSFCSDLPNYTRIYTVLCTLNACVLRLFIRECYIIFTNSNQKNNYHSNVMIKYDK